jgi:hypothetical protein
MRDIIALFRKIVHSSDKVDYDSWPFLLPHIMSVINSRPHDRLDNLSSREIFMGISAPAELNVLFDPILDVIQQLKTDTVQFRKHYDDLIQSLSLMHKTVGTLKAAIHKYNLKAQSVTVPINFTIGDFVLVAIVSQKIRKLHARWRGPYRIRGLVSPYIYECEDLTADIVIHVHVRRMKYFAASDMEVSIPLVETIKAQDTWANEYVPECVLDSFVESNRKLFVQVKWLGFSELESTWEPIEAFYEDAPAIVEAFLAKHALKHVELQRYVKSKQLAL